MIGPKKYRKKREQKKQTERFEQEFESQYDIRIINLDRLVSKSAQQIRESLKLAKEYCGDKEKAFERITRSYFNNQIDESKEDYILRRKQGEDKKTAQETFKVLDDLIDKVKKGKVTDHKGLVDWVKGTLDKAGILA